MLIKKSNDITGNQTRDLPAFSTVPQPIAPPRAPIIIGMYQKCATCAQSERDITKKSNSMF
jgi:hypothetical protein